MIYCMIVVTNNKKYFWWDGQDLYTLQGSSSSWFWNPIFLLLRAPITIFIALKVLLRIWMTLVFVGPIRAISITRSLLSICSDFQLPWERYCHRLVQLLRGVNSVSPFYYEKNIYIRSVCNTFPIILNWYVVQNDDVPRLNGFILLIFVPALGHQNTIFFVQWPL